MARAKKSNTAQEMRESVNDATAAATANMLRLAAEAGTGQNSAGKAETIARLARMCEEAAGHMAKAQDVLFEGHEGGEAAIGHLDAALQCLQALASEGERHIAEVEAEAKTA